MEEIKGKIAERMALVNAEIEAVVKDQQGQGLPYKFRSIYGIYKMVHPILAKHKIFIVPITLNEKRSVVESEKLDKYGKPKISVEITTIVKVRYEFTTDDHSHIDVIIAGEGTDHGDKSMNKAYTSAMKNALVQIFTIPDEMDESDSEYDDIEHSSSNGKGNPEKKDKQQDQKPKQQKPQEQKQEPPAEIKTADEYIKRIEECKNIFEIKDWGEKHKDEIKALPEADYKRVREAFVLHQDILQKSQNIEKLAQLIGKKADVVKAFMDAEDLWSNADYVKALKGNTEAITVIGDRFDDYMADSLGNGEDESDVN